MAEQEGDVENLAAREMVEGRIARESTSIVLNGLEAGNVRVNMVKGLLEQVNLERERRKLNSRRCDNIHWIAGLAVSG